MRTRLGPSPIHGLGLFSVDAVPRGTVVWEFTPGFDLELSSETVERLQGPARDQVAQYTYLDRRTGRYVLCADDARFMNHSDDPNVVSEYGQDPHGVSIAARDIGPGEELTCDYHEFDEESHVKLGARDLLSGHGIQRRGKPRPVAAREGP